MSSETGFTVEEAKAFVKNHFEEFVNRKSIAIGEIHFAPEFVDHGADVPPGLPPGPAGAMQYVSGALKRVPDLHVTIHDIIAEADKVVVRNTWTGTDSASNHKITFQRDRHLADRPSAVGGTLGVFGTASSGVAAGQAAAGIFWYTIAPE